MAFLVILSGHIGYWMSPVLTTTDFSRHIVSLKQSIQLFQENLWLYVNIILLNSSSFYMKNTIIIYDL